MWRQLRLPVIVILLIAVLKIGFVMYNPEPPVVSQLEKFMEVSLVNLISDPLRYKDRRVRVWGFARIRQENTGLYLDRESFEFGIHKNAIWLILNPYVIKPEGDWYMMVEGAFQTDQGHKGLYSGSLTDIEILEPMTSSMFLPPHVIE